MGKEFELKFAAPPERLTAIREAFPGEYMTFAMETTYYDTPTFALSSRKWTLRRRMENGRPVCTLKTPAPGGGRWEWECRRDTVEEAIEELCKLSGEETLKALTQEGLVALCGARFTRHACLISLEDGTAELALDAGVLFGGGRELPFAEVEIEQKTAGEASVIGFAQLLAAQFHLIPEGKSKFQRAKSLAKGE